MVTNALNTGGVACCALLVAVLVHGSRATAAEEPPLPLKAGASAAEQELLLQVRAVQPEAVAAFCEALVVAASVERARAYLVAWGEAPAEGWLPDRTGLDELQERLERLQTRFLDLYHGHFGNSAKGHLARRLKLEGDEPVVAVSDEAVRLARDAAHRAETRLAFLGECQAVRQTACSVLAQWKEAAEALRGRAHGLRGDPLQSRPAFVDKPPATLAPDGSVTGLQIGIVGLTRHPALTVLRSDFTGGCYERYDLGYEVSPMVEAAWYGRKTQIIVPCAVHDRMFTPVAWYNRHRHLPIDRPGATKPYNGTWYWPLDFYHPAVREMLEGFLAEVGARYRGNPNVLVHTTAWEAELTDRAGYKGPFEWGQWPTGGRTPAGIVSFRRYLATRHGDVGQLNAAWGSTYGTFEAIEPPPDCIVGAQAEREALTKALYRGRPTPLYYEFNLFLKQSYADYLAWCYKHLKQADPSHPIAVSPSYGALDGYLCMGRDSFRWAQDTCDVFGSELTDPMEEVYTYSVRRATGRTTGIFECIWNAPHNRSFPPEAEVRAAASCNLWRMVAWGRRILTLYGARDTYGGTANNNTMVLESGYHLLRLGAGVIPALKRKLRSLEDVWLEAPIVEPDIVMIRPTTAQFCEWPWGSVTSTCRRLHDLLQKDHYHYAFVPEEHFVTDRDRLARYRVAILPAATQLASGLTDRLLAWVQEGGVLILAGPAGVFTRYGADDGQLMKRLLGSVQCERTGDLTWQVVQAEKREGVVQGQATIRAACGRGRVLLVNDVEQLGPDSAASGDCLELLGQTVSRRVWASGAPVEIIVRQREATTYVTVVNPDVRRPAQATVHLARIAQTGLDRGLERGFPVPLRREGPGSEFDVSLAPGEGTVVELTTPPTHAGHGGTEAE